MFMAAGVPGQYENPKLMATWKVLVSEIRSGLAPDVRTVRCRILTPNVFWTKLLVEEGAVPGAAVSPGPYFCMLH